MRMSLPNLRSVQASIPRWFRWEGVLLAAVLLYGAFLRSWDLGGTPLWVDEAETGINALAVMKHGVPVDHYLGLPIYENVLTQPWPESTEYAFKDSSYSARGLAIYHTWLPFYATAASFAVAGVQPDTDLTPHGVPHSDEEMYRRTIAARVPAVLFGVVFLMVAFLAARQLYGRDAAWALLVAGTVCNPAIYYARQARYYAPTLALAVGCALLLSVAVRRGRWRDFLFCAFGLLLLFHTHVLSFASASAACALTLPFLLRHPRGLWKTALSLAILVLGIVPWLVGTGAVESLSDLPRAWSLLSLADLAAFVAKVWPYPALAGLAVLGIAAATYLQDRLSDRIVRPFADCWPTFILLGAWAAIALVVFVLFVPAASYFYGRLVLTLMVPGMLFGAMLVAAVARVVAPRYAVFLAPALFVVLLILTRQASFEPSAEASRPSHAFDAVQALRELDIRPGTRIYATPNFHLVLMFYSGMPIQSLAPIRKGFLDHYAGKVLIVQAGPRYESLTADEIEQTLRAAGHPVAMAEACRLEPVLSTLLLREELRDQVAQVIPPPGPLPPWWDALARAQRLKTAETLAQKVAWQGNPIFKGYALPNYDAWWQVYYYRFVNPDQHMGPNLNFAGRIRQARAIVRPSGWVLYQCPGR